MYSATEIDLSHSVLDVTWFRKSTENMFESFNDQLHWFPYVLVHAGH